MPTILYIHGTGVRQPGHGRTYGVIEKAIRASLPGWIPADYFWAEDAGVQLHKQGDSIPKYDDTRSIGPSQDEEAAERESWRLLSSDPLWELGMLGLTGTQEAASDELALGEEAAEESLADRLAGLKASAELRELIAQNALDEVWNPAFEFVTCSEEFLVAAGNPALAEGDVVSATARAIVACAISYAAAQGAPVPPAAARKALLDRLLLDYNADARSFAGKTIAWLAGFALRDLQNGYLARGVTSYVANRKRGAISDFLSPAAGDILLYQTPAPLHHTSSDPIRGARIRGEIRKQIEKISGDVVLLAHSLGGIACVDLLVEKKPANVIGLVTVGSQSPLLYEMDCLTSLRYSDPLPAHFPPWLNVYDPQDLLSYVGEKIFGKDRITDFEIDSGQSFPNSHSAYWLAPELWIRIADFCKECLNP